MMCYIGSVHDTGMALNLHRSKEISRMSKDRKKNGNLSGGEDVEAQAGEEHAAVEKEPQGTVCQIVFTRDKHTGKVLMETWGCSDEDVDRIAESISTCDYYAYQGSCEVETEAGEGSEKEPSAE